MRHLKADVSHRVKRRRPSIFTAPWFRFLLGGGAVVILALTLGPPVAGWLQPPGIRRLSTPEPERARAASAVPAAEPERGRAASAAPGAEPERTRPASPAPGAEPERPGPTVKAAAPSPDPVGSQAAPNGASSAPKVVEAEPAAAARPGTSGVYRIQVGAFLNHKNADRLAERLRGENLDVDVVDGGGEERRALYRVLASPRSGEGYATLLEELRALGYTPEMTAEGATVSGPVPLHAAVEASRRLRAQGIPVRLERELGAPAFRLVRVGKYATAAEAERGRAELAARGVAGIVVRER